MLRDCKVFQAQNFRAVLVVGMDRRPAAIPESFIRLSLMEGEVRIIPREQKQHEPDMYYRTDGTVPLQYLMRDYFERKNLLFEVMRFTFNGNGVREDQTPEQRKMEDDATDVFSDQLGGHALKFN
ncbi:uncharacterized protein [Pyrus communis]|uniref:uncharacterized protein n=1 Tax=Pyrus communis TaxID=23211 RepID=UPI0035C1F7B3